ncbi:unnamed protein product [Caretta caretta]
MTASAMVWTTVQGAKEACNHISSYTKKAGRWTHQDFHHVVLFSDLPVDKVVSVHKTEMNAVLCAREEDTLKSLAFEANT